MSELEVEDRDVLDEAFESGGLRDGDCASLDGPSEEDLSWGLVVLSSERGHSRLDEQGLLIGG